MPSHFLAYWLPRTARETIANSQVFNHAASNQYARVAVGDIVWMTTTHAAGKLILLGRIVVGRVVAQGAAEREVGRPVWSATHHVLAVEREADPFREVDVTRIAARLRFVSPRDRLTIKRGRVNAQQLQTLRKLTPESAKLIESIWRDHSELLAKRPTRPVGAGFGAPKSNREVELAAITHVRKHLEVSGWTVESVERDRCGFDLRCEHSGEVRHVEVKGVAGSAVSFIITASEMARAASDPEFWLYVITSARTDPRLHIWSGREVLNLFQFKPVAYMAKFRGRITPRAG